MKFVLKILIAVSLLSTFMFCGVAYADTEMPSDNMIPEINVEEETFWAKVVEVGEEKSQGLDNHFQDLKLIGKSGEYKGKVIGYPGLTKNISSKQLYKEGDTVLVSVTRVSDTETLIITDKSRLPAIFWATILFVVTVVLVARWHGLRALASLALTLLVMIGYVVPQILAGAEPIRTVVISSVVIVVTSILIVYGWSKKSLLAISGMLIGIFITAFLSWLFSAWAGLTGSSVEEVMFIKDYVATEIDFRGLLLASFIVGTLGVLDDVAITQVSTAYEISEANKELKPWEIYKKSMNIGVDHIASMINTLFLAYAGAAFVLLLLFGLSKAPFDSIGNILNHEQVAIEIIRTLVGSIGLILTVPVTSYLASRVYGKKDELQK